MSDALGAALLDVNVLIALLDPLHANHSDAHSWLSSNGRGPLASCPITLNGCIRVMSDPRYPSVTATPAEVADRLRLDFCARPNHRFWPDDAEPFDPGLFVWSKISGSRKITDAYLLALAVLRGGHLVTFDRSIPMQAVRGANRRHLRILGA